MWIETALLWPSCCPVRTQTAHGPGTTTQGLSGTAGWCLLRFKDGSSGDADGQGIKFQARGLRGGHQKAAEAEAQPIPPLTHFQLLVFVKCALQRSNGVLLTFTLQLTSIRCYGNHCISISLSKRLVCTIKRQCAIKYTGSLESMKQVQAQVF